MEWAISPDGVYTAKDESEYRFRALNIVKAALPIFDTGDYEKAQQILIAHYKEQADGQKSRTPPQDDF